CARNLYYNGSTYGYFDVW
nr:immunoglobulin heavy chain junction region [Mus musculus]